MINWHRGPAGRRRSPTRRRPAPPPGGPTQPPTATLTPRVHLTPGPARGAGPGHPSGTRFRAPARAPAWPSGGTFIRTRFGPAGGALWGGEGLVEGGLPAAVAAVAAVARHGESTRTHQMGAFSHESR